MCATSSETSGKKKEQKREGMAHDRKFGILEPGDQNPLYNGENLYS